MARYEWFAQPDGLLEAIDERVAAGAPAGGFVTPAGVDAKVTAALAAQHATDNSTYARATRVFLDDFAVYAVGGDWGLALAQSCAVLAASGGVIEASATTYPLATKPVMPEGVGLVGQGTSKTRQPTVFKCTTAAAGIAFGAAGTGSHGPASGAFTVDANHVAVQPLYIGRRTQSLFLPVQVFNAAGSGPGGAQAAVWVQEAQNDLFTSLVVEDCTGSGIVWDAGTGGHLVHVLEVNNCGSSGAWAMEFLQSTATPTLYPVPTDIQIVQGGIERPPVGALGLVNHATGADNILDGITFADQTAAAAARPVVRQIYDGTNANTRLRLRDCTVTAATANVTLFDIGASCSLVMQGRTVTVGGKYRWKLGATASVEDDGVISTAYVTDLDPASTGTLDGCIRRRHRYGQELHRMATGDHAVVVSLDVEAGARARILGDGSFQQGNGTDFNYGVARADSTGSWKMINVGVGAGVGVTFGGGSGVVALGAVTAPTSNPSGAAKGFLYVDPADNKLKFRGLSGTITAIANP